MIEGSNEVRTDRASNMDMTPAPLKPGIYKHSKSGNFYRVHSIARHSETLESLVVYEALYPNEVARMWVRPLAMFEELVELNGAKVPRFRFVREA